MATIRDRRYWESDRLQNDRARHNEITKDLLRKNPDVFEEVVAEESIITGDKKRVRVSLRAKREPTFSFGFAPQGAGQNPGAQRGQKISDMQQRAAGGGQGQGQQGQPAPQGIAGAQAGSGAGDEIFEQHELTTDDIAELLLERYDLPFLEEKGAGALRVQTKYRPEGKKKKGPMARLQRRGSVREHLARRIASRVQRGESLPYREEDLRFWSFREDHEPLVNAVFFLLMDTSGSMDRAKRFIARVMGFFFTLYLRRNYKQVDIVFISHDTQWHERTEEDFFTKDASGGTRISSGIEGMRTIIEQRYDPQWWNIYAVHCTDGENEMADNNVVRDTLRKLLPLMNLYGFVEIRSNSSLGKEILVIENQFLNFAFSIVKEPQEIANAVGEILTHDRNRQEDGS